MISSLANKVKRANLQNLGDEANGGDEMDSGRISKMMVQSDGNESLSLELKVRELENQIRHLKEDKVDMDQLELAQFELNERMEQIELSQPKAGFLR